MLCNEMRSHWCECTFHAQNSVVGSQCLQIQHRTAIIEAERNY